MFYVYELRDENNTVFYVGKGSGKRMYQHRYKAKSGEKTHRANKIRKIWFRGFDFSAVIVFKSECEQTAFAKEKHLISKYGQENLTNKTAGGEGLSNPSMGIREKIANGRRGTIASKETREKQRLAKLGIHRTQETKDKIRAYQLGTKKPWAISQALNNLATGKTTFKGMKHTPEAIEKIRQTKLGHSVSQETRNKISKSKRGTIPWNKGKKLK